MKLLIYVESSQSLGFGHYQRCKYLACFFKERQVDVDFVTTQMFDAHISELEHKVHCFDDRENLSAWVRQQPLEALLIDLNKDTAFDSLSDYDDHIRSLVRSGYHKTIVYDDLNHLDVGADAYLIPYPGFSLPEGSKVTYFTGLKYYHLSPGFYEVPRIRPRLEVTKLLIFMGGTDCFGFTVKILRLLMQIPHPFEKITVITGASSDLTEQECQALIGESTLEFVKGTNEPYKYMQEADLGIVNSGLVKYECAFLGLPLITLSNEEAHEGVMQEFSELTGAIHLGLPAQLNEESLQQSLELANYEFREQFFDKTDSIFSQNKFCLTDTLMRFMYE